MKCRSNEEEDGRQIKNWGQEIWPKRTNKTKKERQDFLLTVK